LRSHRRCDRARWTKIILQGQLANLGVQRLQIRAALALLGRGRKHIGSPLQQLGTPLADLVGMNFELLGKLDQRPVAAHRGQRHLRLERR
jgi:hypothetical protein